MLAIAGFVFYMLIPWDGDQVRRRKLNEAVLAVMSARGEIDAFYRQHGRMPKDADEAKMRWLVPSNWVREMHYRDGELTAVIRNVSPEHDGKTIVLRPKAGSDALQWSCVVRGMPGRDLPHGCLGTP